ncbi:hypothetical protein AB7C87_15580 [Natrarchaeobius sp. A-rgal3]|uniref:hypothetical protein n=1 Tax=Natrarchaeobius versutus TaxID=1679078 RepID=UPI00350FCE0F
MSMSPKERFWDVLCEYRSLLHLLLLFATVLLVLTMMAMAMGDQQTDAYVISIVTMTILASTIVPIGYCVWRCGTMTNEFDTDDPSD